MAHPLSFFCDTPQTRQLSAMYGDRLQQMGRSALLDFISVFSAAINSEDVEPYRTGDLIELASVMNIEMTDDLETALDQMDYFDRSDELGLLIGMASMLEGQ